MLSQLPDSHSFRMYFQGKAWRDGGDTGGAERRMHGPDWWQQQRRTSLSLLIPLHPQLCMLHLKQWLWVEYATHDSNQKTEARQTDHWNISEKRKRREAMAWEPLWWDGWGRSRIRYRTPKLPNVGQKEDGLNSTEVKLSLLCPCQKDLESQPHVSHVL